MGLGALFQVVLALVSGGHEQATNLPALTPREKAALVVVAGLPAPKGVAGILVQEWSKELPRPRRALVFVDQEGGAASTFDGLPPAGPASSYGSAAEAFGAGKATAKGLKEAGVDIDLAPVVDLAGGPLGSRHFRRPAFALAFARGLAAGGSTSCPKHFPGLGSARISTDESPTVRARLLPAELRAFRRAVAGGAECVMVGHAFYRRLGLGSRASFNPAAYRLLRREGFQGVAITDSVSVSGASGPCRRRSLPSGRVPTSSSSRAAGTPHAPFTPSSRLRGGASSTSTLPACSPSGAWLGLRELRLSGGGGGGYLPV